MAAEWDPSHEDGGEILSAVGRPVEHAGPDSGLRSAPCAIPRTPATERWRGPLERGTRLFQNRFRLLRCLGAGGAGTVYEALDEVRSEAVALKVLNNVDTEAIYAIKEEFRSLCDVVHPNLVPLHELYAEGDQWFFTMDLVRGTDLLDYVRSRARADGLPFGESSLRSVLKQVVSGVLAIHQSGKLHCDLKPSNILVTEDEHVVILDFGLVCDPRLREPDRIVGTPAYMSPEQISGQDLTTASDWYSVGLMLFEGLTGRSAFDGPFHRTVAKRLTRGAPSPGEYVESLPHDLQQLCMSLLCPDPKQRPTGAAIASVLGIVPGSLGAPPSIAGSPRFVGRNDEIATLHECFDSAASGSPVLALIAGPSGMGKTALVWRFLSTLEGKDRPLVLSGRCFERESVPYKGVDSLVDELGRYLEQLPSDEIEHFVSSDTTDLVRAFPVLRGVKAIARRIHPTEPTADVQEARRRAFTSLKEILRNIASSRPIVLFVDDLQWADLDSARALVDLITPPHPPAILTLGVYRVDSGLPSPALEEIEQRATRASADLSVKRILLGPLNADEASRLASSLIPSENGSIDAQTAAVAADARGNPFFIEVLSRYWSSRSRPFGDRPSLDRIILERLSEETVFARRLLEVVAVAGQPIDHDVALAAADIKENAYGAVSALRAGRFTRTTMGRGALAMIEPYHDRIRECVVAALDEESLRRCHAKLAFALESSGRAEPDILARQFHGARELKKAYAYAVAAAEAASRALAFDRAGDLYGLALDSNPDESAVVALRRSRGDALSRSGRCALAAREYACAAERAGGDEAFELRRQAAAQWFTAGHVDAGLIALEPLLHDVGLRLPASPLAVSAKIALSLGKLQLRGLSFRDRPEEHVSRELLRRIDAARSASDGLASTDPIRAASMMLEATLLALEAGEPRRVAWALSQYGLLVGSGGTPNRRRAAERIVDRSLALSERTGSAEARVHGWLSRAKLDVSLGKWKDGVRHADECSNDARNNCVGSWACVTVAHNIALFALQALGDFPTMSARASEYLKEASEIGDLYAEVTTMIYTGMARLAADDSASARTRIDSALARWRGQAFLFQNWLAVQALAYCDLYEGRPDDALRRLSDAWPQMQSRHLHKLAVVRPFALRIRGAAAVACAGHRPGSRRRLLRLAMADARALERFGRIDGLAASKVIDAGIYRMQGDSGRAAEELERAAMLYSEADMALDAASARLATGTLLGGAEGRRISERAQLEMEGAGIRDARRWSRMLVPVIGT